MSKINVDLRGLKRIVLERGEVTLLDELVQNALDNNDGEITVEITSPAINRVRVVVTDNDPTGVANLDDLITLFAPSVKREDASKRGFMNVGEKLAVAYAVAGEIRSTSGSWIVTADETKRGRKPTAVGTVADLTFPLSKDVMAKMIDRARTYLVPTGIRFTVNGEVVPTAMPTKTATARLNVYVGVDEDGETVMRERRQNTQLDLYTPDARGSWIYVLGIPVQRVEDLPVSVDVQGRLKADMKRDQIPAAAMHKITVAVADALIEELTPEDLTGWVRPVMADASDAVVRSIVETEFGADAMTRSVSDPAANIRAVEEGRNLIPTSAYSHDVGERIRSIRANDASFAAPSHTQYGATVGGILDLEIHEDLWTPSAAAVVEYAHKLFTHLFPGCTLAVTIYGGKRADCMAAMGRDGNVGRLSLNQGEVGWGWFEPANRLAILATLIHEFAHFEAYKEGHSYHWGDACAELGAQVALWGVTS